jgi:hypothetical protein
MAERTSVRRRKSLDDALSDETGLETFIVRLARRLLGVSDQRRCGLRKAAKIADRALPCSEGARK